MGEAYLEFGEYVERLFYFEKITGFVLLNLLKRMSSQEGVHKELKDGLYDYCITSYLFWIFFVLILFVWEK